MSARWWPGLVRPRDSAWLVLATLKTAQEGHVVPFFLPPAPGSGSS